MIKIKSVLANFGSKKQFKVKKAYSLQQKLISFGKNDHFWQFLNEGKVKLLKIKQDTIRQKHKKRWCKYVGTYEMYTHEP